MISRQCRCCPALFDVRYPSDPKQFCSKRCASRTNAEARGMAGAASPSWRGGVSRHPLYPIWTAMKQRCLNPNNRRYADYGGRGIAVCPQWVASFEQFLADVGDRPSADLSIDRIDNEGNYEPGNVRWATKAQQSANTRRRASKAEERTCPECGHVFSVQNPSRPNIYCSKPCSGKASARRRSERGDFVLRKPKPRKKKETTNG